MGNDDNTAWVSIDESVSDVYHIYSNGHRSPTLFYDEQDFIKAVNLLARYSYEAGCTVLAYTFCDTHFHLLIRATLADVQLFIQKYRRCLLKFLSDAHGSSAGRGCPFDLEISFKEMETVPQVKKTLCYILRNSLDVNRELLPVYYRWGSASLYFSDHDRLNDRGVLLSEMSTRRQEIMLKFRMDVPEGWRVDEHGMILPQCFVDYHSVDRLFVTANAFLAFMHFRNEDETMIRRGMMESRIERLSDKELRSRISRLSREYFEKTVEELTLKEKIALAAFLKKDYPLRQLGRLLRVEVGLME